jgi:hypothetical protein
MNWLLREPERDPKLGAALRQLDPAPEAARAEDLRRRIMARARSRLAELDAPAARWWEWLSRWVRIAVPVGLAASLAAGLLLPRRSDMANLRGYSIDTSSDSTLIAAAFSEPSARGQMAAHLIAPEGNDWLLEQAFTQ